MQGLPVQEVLEAGATCVCEERGFCPRNPDGPCQCDHHHSSSEPIRTSGEEQVQTSDDGNAHPVIQSCDGGGQTAIGSTSPYRWLVPRGTAMTNPTPSVISYEIASRIRSPQQVGDDIFHPPRPAA